MCLKLIWTAADKQSYDHTDNPESHFERKLERNAGVRVLRDNVVIHDGKLASLKRFKDDAKEVTKGYECGIQIEKYNDIKEGDIIEAYILEEIKR